MPPRTTTGNTLFSGAFPGMLQAQMAGERGVPWLR